MGKGKLAEKLNKYTRKQLREKTIKGAKDQRDKDVTPKKPLAKGYKAIPIPPVVKPYRNKLLKV